MRAEELSAVLEARARLLVEGGEVRLTQVVCNLLTNAARYTTPGGLVSIEATREGDWVTVRVRDNGIGISPALLPRLFQLFFQGEQGIERASGGLGLGLALALVESFVPEVAHRPPRRDRDDGRHS